MFRVLILLMALALAVPAQAAMTVDEAQQKVAEYLGQLDAMCTQRAFLTTGFADEPGKTWKAELDALALEFSSEPNLPPLLKKTPNMLIHLGLQTVFAKKCIPKDNWDRKNVTDELGAYANPAPKAPVASAKKAPEMDLSLLEILDIYASVVKQMEFTPFDRKSCRKGNAKLVETVICDLTPYSSILFADENGDGNITSVSFVGEPVNTEEAEYNIQWSCLAMIIATNPGVNKQEEDTAYNELGISYEALSPMGSSRSTMLRNNKLTLTRDRAKGTKLTVRPVK